MLRGILKCDFLHQGTDALAGYISQTSNKLNILSVRHIVKC